MQDTEQIIKEVFEWKKKRDWKYSEEDLIVFMVAKIQARDRELVEKIDGMRIIGRAEKDIKKGDTAFINAQLRESNNGWNSAIDEIISLEELLKD